MVLDKKVIFSELRDVLILVGLSVTLTLSGAFCRSCVNSTKDLLLMISMTSLLWILLWKGNAFLATFLSRKISWIAFPVRRFVFGLLAAVGYTLVVVYVLARAYEQVFAIDLSPTMVTSVVITIVISLFMHGRSFLLNWRQASIEAEKYQHESMVARYESLKTQISPHFLFNSLNALTQLIYEDKYKAEKFIHQLADVYRYLLETRDKEVVPLSEELKFVRSYLFLQGIRFEDKLTVTVSLDDAKGFVAPLALQMVIENAIKHNVVSEEHPLNINVYCDDGCIVAENAVQEKKAADEPSAGFGLENIRRRYEILTARKVTIDRNERTFTARIPLLQSDEINKRLTSDTK